MFAERFTYMYDTVDLVANIHNNAQAKANIWGQNHNPEMEKQRQSTLTLQKETFMLLNLYAIKLLCY